MPEAFRLRLLVLAERLEREHAIGHNSRLVDTRLGRDPASRFSPLTEHRSGIRFPDAECAGTLLGVMRIRKTAQNGRPFDRMSLAYLEWNSLESMVLRWQSVAEMLDLADLELENA